MTALRSQGYSMKALCAYVGISRQAYHQRLNNEATNREIINKAEEKMVENRRLRSRVGIRSIYHKEQLKTLLGINRFEQEMSARGYSLKPVKSYIKTTDSRGHHNKFPNRASGLNLQSENQLIVGDITYYRNGEELYYIFLFRDYYTLEIKGMLGGKTMEGIYAEKCIRQVFSYNKQRKYNYETIVHTDAGGQYRSNKFIKLLQEAQLHPSHAQNCLENGLAEQTNGLVKNEYLIDYDIKSTSHLNRVLSQIKHQVNEVWPSKALGYMTPKAFAEKMRNTDKSERPIKIVKEIQ
jgi:putative transposase